MELKSTKRFQSENSPNVLYLEGQKKKTTKVNFYY